MWRLCNPGYVLSLACSQLSFDQLNTIICEDDKYLFIPSLSSLMSYISSGVALDSLHPRALAEHTFMRF